MLKRAIVSSKPVCDKFWVLHFMKKLAQARDQDQGTRNNPRRLCSTSQPLPPTRLAILCRLCRLRQPPLGSPAVARLQSVRSFPYRHLHFRNSTSLNPPTTSTLRRPCPPNTATFTYAPPSSAWLLSTSSDLHSQDFCRDTGSARSTLPVCNVRSASNACAQYTVHV